MIALVAVLSAPSLLAAPAPPQAVMPVTDVKPGPSPATTGDPAIDTGDLKLLLEPLTRAELEVEANGWFDLLRAKVREISEAELAVRRKNREIASLDRVKLAAEKVAAASADAAKQSEAAPPGSEQEKAAAEKLAKAKATLEKSVAKTNKDAAAPTVGAADPVGPAQASSAPIAGDAEIAKRAVETAQKHAVTDGKDAAGQTVAAVSKEAQASQDIQRIAQAPAAAGTPSAPLAEAATESSQKSKTLAAKVDEAASAKSDVKVKLIDYSTQLGDERTAIADRLKIVLDELDTKGGNSKDIRQYMAAVGGLKLDVSDTTGMVARLKAWAVAEEGGLRLLREAGVFLSYLLGSVLLARVVRVLLRRGLKAARTGPSQLLRRFMADMSGRVIVFVGFIAGLSAFGLDLSPLLAIIGAGGFVVAFALQGTLSNFASGLLIMVNKPFDVDDTVEVGNGIKGRVVDVAMFSTVIGTDDGFTKIVPNNTIWGGVIVNETTGTKRDPRQPELLAAAE